MVKDKNRGIVEPGQSREGDTSGVSKNSILLSAPGMETVHHLIENPPEPNEALKAATQKRKALLGGEGAVIPGHYRHYKGKLYEVFGTAIHTETREQMVVYRPLYGEKELCVRPEQMFKEMVDVDGELVPRFRLCSGEETEGRG